MSRNSATSGLAPGFRLLPLTTALLAAGLLAACAGGTPEDRPLPAVTDNAAPPAPAARPAPPPIPAPSPATSAPAISALANSSWTFVEIMHRPLPAGVTATLAFHQPTDGAEQISGSTGCNRFTGTANSKPGTLHFGVLAMTRMACIGAHQATENTLLDVFQQTATYTRSGPSLTLRDAKGNILARLQRAS